jgi:hypothetical protein
VLGLEAESIRPHVLLYPLGVWVVMAVGAVINGGVRESREPLSDALFYGV